MTSLEDNDLFAHEVTAEELLCALKALQRDKSLGPDGWPPKFFMFFYYLVYGDPLKKVEKFRCIGVILTSLNSTFLAMIPKKD